MLPRQIAWLQAVTLIWMVVECAVSLLAAAHARSAALLAFGADSFVELLSAIVVLLQFMPRFALRKSQAERAAAVLLFLLAGTVVAIAVLSWHHGAESSPVGMAITALALVVMPVLAWLKRRQARIFNNRALAADAAQSATCFWLAAVALMGLVVNSLWHITWVDSVAAVAAVPILFLEGKRAWSGDSCACGCAD